MNVIRDVETLQSLYGEATAGSLAKVAPGLTPAYRRWIEASRLVILTTVGPEGTDASPRGDDGPVVRIADARTVHLPDWRGNNRIDSLRNIVRDGRASLLFMVPGSGNVVRINGHAQVSADAALTAAFEKDGRRPRTVIIVTISEVYFQCAKALMRSRFWQTGDESAGLPSAGDFLAEAQEGFDGKSYDAAYRESARSRLW